MKRKVFWRKTKFEKFLFEVFADEAVDDKVDGGVEHERQLVDRGDRQPQLPGEIILGMHAQFVGAFSFFDFMRPVVKVHVVDALVDYPWGVADEEDCNDAKKNLCCLRISVVEASTDLLDSRGTGTDRPND